MSASLFDFSGRRIWVFGGAGYLGREVVGTLDQQNAGVVCLDLPGRAESFVAEAGLSPRVEAASLDITQLEKTKAWIEREVEAGRTPDGAAFLTTPGLSFRVDNLSADAFNRYNELGLTALFCAVREIGQAMAARGSGSLVLFSSMYGQVAPDPSVYHEPMDPNPLPYGMHKAAINQMTRYLGVTWGPRNVRCNSVAPGPFPNPNVQRDHPEFVARLAAKVPMKRIGQSREVSGAVAFLLSDAATYVNGHNLVVDGGWTAW